MWSSWKQGDGRRATSFYLREHQLANRSENVNLVIPCDRNSYGKVCTRPMNKIGVNGLRGELVWSNTSSLLVSWFVAKMGIRKERGRKMYRWNQLKQETLLSMTASQIPSRGYVEVLSMCRRRVSVQRVSVQDIVE